MHRQLLDSATGSCKPSSWQKLSSSGTIQKADASLWPFAPGRVFAGMTMRQTLCQHHKGQFCDHSCSVLRWYGDNIADSGCVCVTAALAQADAKQLLTCIHQHVHNRATHQRHWDFVNFGFASMGHAQLWFGEQNQLQNTFTSCIGHNPLAE